MLATFGALEENVTALFVAFDGDTVHFNVILFPVVSVAAVGTTLMEDTLTGAGVTLILETEAYLLSGVFA